jgi:hypothetical protein
LLPDRLLLLLDMLTLGLLLLLLLHQPNLPALLLLLLLLGTLHFSSLLWLHWISHAPLDLHTGLLAADCCSSRRRPLALPGWFACSSPTNAAAVGTDSPSAAAGAGIILVSI